METLTCQYDRIKCEAKNGPPPARILQPTIMAAPSSCENQMSNGSSSTINTNISHSKASSPTDPMTEELEAAVSPGVKRRIDAMVADVTKFNDLEKLLLYLKMPTGGAGFDSGGLKSTSPSLPVTRVEQTQAFNWIRSHLEEFSDTSLPKQEVYEDYKAHCTSAERRFLSPADFGKIMKNVFPQVKARRLGTRGNARYCYSGLRKKSEVQPPLLPSMESPHIHGPNDLPSSSSVCKCSQEQQQADLANAIVICEWAEKILTTRFQTTDALAHHLVRQKLVSSSMASLTVLSGSKEGSSTGAHLRPLRPDSGMAKLPITPEERHKETQHQLQKKIQQRQLSRMKEEQTRQASERPPGSKGAELLKTGKAQQDEQKLLSRSQSMPNEMQMNARAESQMGGPREHDAVLVNGNHCPSGRQSDHHGAAIHSSGLQTNNNSNNNSNQLSAANATTSMMPTVKESPNNKRRFTPIQPKTPVRDSTVKVSINKQVVLIPNGTFLNTKGQKIQQLPGLQLIQIPAPSNGSTQQVATIPPQNIPNSKLIASGTAKLNGSSPGTSRGQNVVVLQNGQVLHGSSVLVVNQSPSAGLTGSFVNGAIPGSTVSTGLKDASKMLPSQSNNHLLQLQTDGGAASPQGVTSVTSAAQLDNVPSLTSPSLLSPPPIQQSTSQACPSSSSVLPRSVNAETLKISSQSGIQPVFAVNSATLGKPTVTLSQRPSTSVTFSTLPMQKQNSGAQDGELVEENGQSKASPDGRLDPGAATSDSVSMSISASALLAMLSDTANKEQGLDESRGIRKAQRTSSQIGGTVQGHQPVCFAMTGAVTTPTASQVAQQSLSPASMVGKVSEDALKAQLAAISSSNLKNFVQTLPNKTQIDLQPANTGLISILAAPALETPNQQASDLRQIQEGHQLASSSGQAVPVYSLPIHTASQPLDLAAHGIQIPIPVDIGNKRVALSSGQYVQTVPVAPLQHRTTLPQINEVATDAAEAANGNIMVKQETEILGGQSMQQGNSMAQAISFMSDVGQCMPVGASQQTAGTDIQGRQCITPSSNPHCNTATPVPLGLESVPQSPNNSSQVYFTFTPIQQSTEQQTTSVTSPSPVKPMQKPKPTIGTAQGSFATPSRKRRSSGSTRRPSVNGTSSSCLPPVVSRQITPTPSPSGSRCSTPLSPSLVSGNKPSDSTSMPPPSPAMMLTDLNQFQTSQGSDKHGSCNQTLGQASWNPTPMGSRKRNPSGPATLMQPAKQLSLDANFLPEELTDLNIRGFDSNLDFTTAQQQYQRSHSVPLPAYQSVYLSQDRFISAMAEQRGITGHNRNFGAKRNLTQALQEIQVTDEDFGPEEHFLEGSDTAFSDILSGDLQQASQGQWVADTGLGGIQGENDLSVDFPIAAEPRDSGSDLGLAQGLGDNSNSTTSTLNEDIAAMDDIECNPVFRDFPLPSWQQIGSNSSLATLECGM